MNLMEKCALLGVKGFRPSNAGTSINAIDKDGRAVLNIAVAPEPDFRGSTWYSQNKLRPVIQERALPTGLPTVRLAPAVILEDELVAELEADAMAIAPATAPAKTSKVVAKGKTRRK